MAASRIYERNCVMKDATLAQGNQVLSLILQKKKSAKKIQDLLASGLLSDLLDADPRLVKRREFQRFLSLPPLVTTYEVEAVATEVAEKMVLKDGVYQNGSPAVPRGLTFPQRDNAGEKQIILLLQLDCEDFLAENDQDIDRNIEEKEALREMKKRGYLPGGLLEMADLIVAHPELRKSYLSIVGFQVLLVNDKETLCSVIWQSGHLAIRTKLDGNCGSNCRFLAKRQY